MSRSVFQLAADGFVATMAEPLVIATISVNHALVAEVPVAAGSALAGQPIAAANVHGHARVAALQKSVGALPERTPALGRRLTPGNQLMVVTT